MAVGGPRSFKADGWIQQLSGTGKYQSHAESMVVSGTMSANRDAPSQVPLEGSNINNPLGQFSLGRGLPPLSTNVSTAPLSTPGPVKPRRKPSKGKVPSAIKRVTSTPHMRALGGSDADSLSPTTADKRRNKLGYHRTSVACGHCRRRKIRCLPAPNDPQGRCSNCIRLKKECNFFPVDQQMAAQRAQNSSGKGSASATEPSPLLPPGAATDSIDEYAPYGQPTSHPGRFGDSLGPAGGLGLGLSEESETAYSADSSLAAQIEPPAREGELGLGWNGAAITGHPTGRMDPPSEPPSYWRTNEPGMTSAFPSYERLHSGAVPFPGEVAESYPQQSEQGWGHQSRSMSYSAIEQYHSPFPPMADSRRRTSTFAYPLHVDTANHQPPHPDQASLSAPVNTHGIPSYPYQHQPWTLYPPQSAIPAQALPSQQLPAWYGEPEQIEPTSEADGAVHYSDAQPSTYYQGPVHH